MPAPKNLLWLVWAASAALGVAAQEAVPVEEDFTPAEIVGGDALAELAQLARETTEENLKLAKRGFGGSCNLSNMQIRREWRTLTRTQRRTYVNAVKCLQTKPSVLNATNPFPIGAAKSLFDDFVGIHFLQTPNIHVTASFLTWHRYFIWAYGEKLRTECQYNGPLPYWEWGLDGNPDASPLFDGSDSSLSGNGAFIEHEGIQMLQFASGNILNMEPGTGGGCVTTGPFKDMSVNFGYVAMPAYGSPTFLSVPDPLGPNNGRCFKRDLNGWVAKRFNSFLNSTTLILQNNNIEMFQAIMQGDDRYVIGELGVHGGGHYILGGDPGSDPFISPGDPVFYLHHAQIDRLYWVWQSLNFANRQGIHGTSTIQNNPPSADMTVEDTVDILPLFGPRKIKDLMNTVGGTPFCYIYL